MYIQDWLLSNFESVYSLLDKNESEKNQIHNVDNVQEAASYTFLNSYYPLMKRSVYYIVKISVKVNDLFYVYYNKEIVYRVYIFTKIFL